MMRLIRTVILKTNLALVFPVHPRTIKSLEKNGMLESFRKIKKMIITEPLDYLDFMRLVKDGRLILTDSGGIQEEAAYLKVPTITLRESTERPSTIECGANHLHHLGNLRSIIKKVEKIMGTKKHIISDIPLFDGRASERIIEIIKNKYRI